jgi:hypothetical protein
MRTGSKMFVGSLAMAGALVFGSSADASVSITDFDSFVSDALYPSWNLAGATSGPTSYTITATGYGSNYKYIEDPLRVAGSNTDIQLTITLDGPPAADGHLGPIVALIDGDGTHAVYAWYGQTLGSHVLTMDSATPTWYNAAGGVAGLDVENLIHMHMQLDPGGFGVAGAYTAEWEDLSLVPEPASLGLLGCSLGLVALRRRRA